MHATFLALGMHPSRRFLGQHMLAFLSCANDPMMPHGCGQWNVHSINIIAIQQRLVRSYSLNCIGIGHIGFAFVDESLSTFERSTRYRSDGRIAG